MRFRMMLAAFLMTAAITAETSAAPPVSSPKAAAACLTKGRAQSDKDPAAAVKTFEECLVLKPNDAAVLSELGLAALHNQEIDKAERASRRAIEVATESGMRGASAYNLGLVLETRGDRTGAVAAYKQSLAARRNRIVLERLRTLDSQAAGEFGPFAPQPMAAIASVAAFCKPLIREASPQDDDADGMGAQGCRCGQQIKHRSLNKPPPPFEAVELFALECRHDSGVKYGHTDYELAVKVHGRWYVGEQAAAIESNNACGGSSAVQGLQVKELVAGEPPALILHLLTEIGCGRGSPSSQEDESLVVVGIGPSGKPSMTPPILKSRVKRLENYDDKPSRKIVDVHLQIELAPGGQLIIQGNTAGLDKELAAELQGTHPLRFQ